jgi:hypothetical protein
VRRTRATGGLRPFDSLWNSDPSWPPSKRGECH